MKLKAKGNRAVVIFKKKEEKKGKIILADTASTLEPYATVMDIEPDNELNLEIGDKVFLTRYAGHEIVLDDEKFYVVELKDIVAILND